MNNAKFIDRIIDRINEISSEVYSQLEEIRLWEKANTPYMGMYKPLLGDYRSYESFHVIGVDTDLVGFNYKLVVNVEVYTYEGSYIVSVDYDKDLVEKTINRYTKEIELSQANSEKKALDKEVKERELLKHLKEKYD